MRTPVYPNHTRAMQLVKIVMASDKPRDAYKQTDGHVNTDLRVIKLFIQVIALLATRNLCKFHTRRITESALKLIKSEIYQSSR